MHALTNQSDKADARSVQLVGSFPASPRAWFQRGRIKLAQHADAESREAFARFLKVVDADEPAWAGMIKFAKERVRAGAQENAPVVKP